jgi:hypothetical protein
MVNSFGGLRLEAFLSGRRWERALALIVGLVYWIANRSIDGPAYQQDEVGYLINAAFFAGHVIDGFSSYHAGYSLFLAPLFMVLDSPEEVWQGVKLVNAALWSLSFLSLALLLRKAMPKTTESALLLAVVTSAAYPAWVAMAGYAFSQSAFVLVFVLACLAHLSWKPDSPASVLPASCLCGFLYWIHPTGIGVIAASILAVGATTVRTRRPASLLLHIAVILGFVLTYKLGIQPWMAERMTPPGYEPRGHYPSITSVAARFGEARFWRDWVLVVFGQLSYVAIATFGAAIFGAAHLLRSVKSLLRGADRLSTPVIPSLALFLLASLISVALITATSFASQPHGPGSTDEWIYGRYVEGTLLPLLAIGLLATRRWPLALAAAIAVVGVGLILQPRVEGMNWFNLVCVQAFWPQALASNASLEQWFLIGAAGVALSSWLLAPLGLLAVFAAYIATIQVQLDWHRGFVNGYSRPTAMVEFVRSNYPKGACVGFDPRLPIGFTAQMSERIRLYSFYLYDYGFRRTSYQEWLKKCDGPLLTFEPAAGDEGSPVKVIGREMETGLLVLAKESAKVVLPEPSLRRGRVAWYAGRSRECQLGHCYTAVDLAPWSQAGRLAGGGVLESTGRAGVLFFGPYLPMPAGSYTITIDLDVDGTKDEFVDVVSAGGTRIHFKSGLSDLSRDANSRLTLQFELTERVTDLEVRLHVQAESKVRFRSYAIGKRTAG